MGKENDFDEAVCAEQFVEWIKRDVFAKLEKVTREEDLRFGPEYCVTTSKGLALRMPTVFVRNWNRYDGLSSNINKIFFIFACDTDGQLLGYRLIELCPFEKDGYVGAWGEIFLGKKNSGLCMPIEMVHLDFLQREADFLKTKVSYSAGNNNLGYLRDAREVLRRDPSDNRMLQWVKTLEEEQLRWQSVYGPHGMLGFDTVGCRMFYPGNLYPGNRDCLDLEGLGEIKLVVRKESVNGRLLAFGDVSSQETVTDREVMREERQRFFRQGLLPQIRALGSL